MSRFTRFSRVSPVLLLCRRERRAWLSLGLTLVLMAGTAALLAQQVLLFISGSNSSFIGIAYEQAGQSFRHASPLIARSSPPQPSLSPQLPLPEAPEALLPETVEDFAPADITAEVLPPEEWVDFLPAPPHRHPTSRQTATKAEKATAATPLQTPHPTYPARMRQRRMEGDVGICIHIDSAGIPTAVDILTEVHPEFAEHTRRWILRHWRFRAARKDEQAVISTLRTTIRYRLN